MEAYGMRARRRRPQIPARLDRQRTDGSVPPSPVESELELKGVQYVGADLDFGDYERVTLEDCAIVGSRIIAGRHTEIRIVASHIRSSDLSGLSITQGCIRSRLLDCKLTAASFGGGRLQDVQLVECLLNETSLRLSTVRRAEVHDCRVVDVDLTNSVLEDTCFAGSSISAMDLAKASCSRVDFTMAKELDVKRASDLSGCTVTTAQVLGLAVQLANEGGLVVRA